MLESWTGCADCAEIPPCPPCAEHEVCQQSYPLSCDTCPANVCVPDAGSSGAHDAVIGAAVGGCLGAILLVGGLYLLYRRLQKTMPLLPPPSPRPTLPPMPPSVLMSPQLHAEDIPERSPHSLPRPRTAPGTVAPASSHDLWRITEMAEPPETPHRVRAAYRHWDAMPTISGSPVPPSNATPDPPRPSAVLPRAASSFEVRSPRRCSGPRNQPYPPARADESCRDSTFYAFLNDLVDEYEDHSDYGSWDSERISRQTSSARTNSGRTSRRTPTVPTRIQLVQGRVELVRIPSHLRTRRSLLPEATTPDTLMEDPFSESIQIAAMSRYSADSIHTK
ncbi:hypothetical protein CBS9595_003840 [Malassezia furfur]|nr:hypothetical protein CBS9595_003840 [Malassezia furfur]